MLGMVAHVTEAVEPQQSEVQHDLLSFAESKHWLRHLYFALKDSTVVWGMLWQYLGNRHHQILRCFCYMQLG